MVLMSIKPCLALKAIPSHAATPTSLYIGAIYAFACTEPMSNKPVWTPSATQGKPFPVKRVPVEVWGIGAFKFKGIQGISKVRFLPT